MPHNTSEVVLYGGMMGLMGKPQIGWQRAYVEAVPAGCRVLWFNMPDAAAALQVLLREEAADPRKIEEAFPVTEIGVGKGRRRQWRQIRDEVEASVGDQALNSMLFSDTMLRV